MRDKILILGIFGFATGILWHSFFFVDLYFALLFALVSLAVMLFSFFTRLRRLRAIMTPAALCSLWGFDDRYQFSDLDF